MNMLFDRINVTINKFYCFISYVFNDSVILLNLVRKIIQFYWMRMYISSVYGQFVLYNNKMLFTLLLVVLFDTMSGDFISYLVNGQGADLVNINDLILDLDNPADKEAIDVVIRGGSIRSIGNQLMLDRGNADSSKGGLSKTETVVLVVLSVAIGFLLGRKH